jgi:hypothetical protein
MLLTNSNNMALGEQIEDSRGKITSQRVLEVKEIPKTETSFVMEGTFRETPSTNAGTYTAVLVEGGVLFGEGQGIVTAKDGQGMATWTGHGIGMFTGRGKVSFRGSVLFRTPSNAGGKLSSINNTVAVFEYEVDEMGNCPLKVGSGNS